VAGKVQPSTRTSSIAISTVSRSVRKRRSYSNRPRAVLRCHSSRWPDGAKRSGCRFESCRAHQPSLASRASARQASPGPSKAKRAKVVSPKGEGAKADRCRERRGRRADHRRKGQRRPRSDKNIENNPMQSRNCAQIRVFTRGRKSLVGESQTKGAAWRCSGTGWGDAAMPHSKPARCPRSGQTDARSQSKVES